MTSIDWPALGRMPSLEGATGWLNSSPLAAADLGKVVVINFCTYSCINWLRSLPYVRAWAAKYKDQGLVMIGVHTPEFSFERNVENVREALAEMRIVYPVALDNDYTVWDAFANRYWPALYFVDAHGRIRHHRFGEGDYERSESVIQQLLVDAGATDVGAGLVSVNAAGPEAEADWDDLQSPETYLGYEQTRYFASPEEMTRERRRVYSGPESLKPNEWSLLGDWTATAESVVSNEPHGRIQISFHARDVNLVMGPLERGPWVPFRVSIDGELPLGASGSDVDGEGAGALVQQKMYQLVRQQGPINDRVFAIEFLDRAAEGFVFTFG